MVDSSPSNSLAVPSQQMSPPTTPPNYIPRPASQTPSDDSSVIEMSFEYLPTGERVSRGSHPSPPTPIEDHPRTSLPKDISSRSGSPDSVISVQSSRRRVSLSRSESMPGAVPPHEQREAPEPRPSIASTSVASAARSFQRTVSGPVSLAQSSKSVSQPAGTSSLSARTSSISAKLRGQLPGDARMSMRTSQVQRELRLQTDGIQEEKENMGEVEAPVDWVTEAGLKRRSIPPRSAPLDSLEAHHYSSASGRGSFTSGSSNPSNPLVAALPSHQRAANGGRLIASKPTRALRVQRPTAKSAIGKIPEVDVPYDGEGEEADAAIKVDDWPDEASAAVRVLNGVGARERVNALSSSASNRPRRSASLSETSSPEGHRANGLSYQSSADAYRSASRPGSSLGHASNGHVSAASRVARAAYESKMRRDRDVMPEERGQRESDYRGSDASQHQRRQSPSPTHIAVSSSQARPYSHQRRPSDTVRDNLPIVPTQTILSTAASSTLVSSRPSESPPPEDVAPRSSPPVRNYVNGVASSARHRRSPTAPEPSTNRDMAPSAPPNPVPKTWAAGGGRDDAEDDPAPPMQPPPAPSIRPVSAAPATQAVKTSPPPLDAAKHRHLVVNKKTYARLDLIGRGGTSRVYRVMNNASEIYAIKRIALDQTDAETMAGYMNEISLLKRLDGNNRIIRLLDSEVKPGPGGTKGYLMLVMECGEIDLARLLQDQRKEPMNMVWVAYYFQQMLQAVQVIHEEKIVHTDLKPANFVLVRGQLKLIDFGIANAIANDTTNIQRDHQMGTVNYMSPEAIEVPDGKRRLKVGRASDVWSLGCILYQMIYGQPPFQHLSFYHKMKAIPDGTYQIDFPDYATPVAPVAKGSPGSPNESPPKMEHLKRRVRKDVIMCMKSCLVRNPKERATIPELLEEDWLLMREPTMPTVRDLLQEDEVVITPYFMRQLLEYGMGLGAQQARNETLPMSDEALTIEGKRLVEELRAIG